MEVASRNTSENVARKIKFSSLQLSLFIAVSCFYIILTYAYKNLISPRYPDYGLVFLNLPVEDFVLSYLFCILPVFFLPKKFQRPSDITVWILYLVSYFPTILLRFHVSTASLESTLGLFLTLLICLFGVEIVRRIQIVPFFVKKINVNKRTNRIVLFWGFLLIASISLYISNGKFSELDFSSVYKRRLEAREVDLFGLEYIISIGRSVLIIFCCYFFIVQKRVIYLILMFMFSYAVFSFDGTKSSLILPIIFLGYGLYVKFTRSSYLLIVLVIFLSLAAIGENYVRGTYSISDYLLRRMFIIPGLINGLYWDFFQDNEYVYLTDSIFRSVLGPVYDRSAPYIIGELLDGGIATNANTGIWLGGYAHAGILGVAFVTLTSGIALGVIDSFTQRSFYVLGAITCCYIGINWSEQMLHTSILSGGILFVFLSVAYYSFPKILNKE